MQHEQMKQRRTCSGVGRLQAVVRHGSGVGVLVAVLLLPLTAAGQDTPEALTTPDEDEVVEALAATAPRAGDLDASFSDEGKVTTEFRDFADAQALAIQPDRKILVAGNSAINGRFEDFTLARYRSNGRLDSTFNGTGKVTLDLQNNSLDDTQALAIQPDGKILVAGDAGSASGVDFALVRYLPTGTLDSTFGTDGKVFTDFEGRNDHAFAMALQPDGKMVVVGESAIPFGSGSAFALARYLPDGSPDPTFGTNGTVITDFGSGSSSH